MEIRHPIHPEHGKILNTSSLRKEFLIDDLFEKDKLKLVYSHIDRIIIGGLNPVHNPLRLEGGKETASEFFFERREGGVINIGGNGRITLDGETYTLGNLDGLYISRGTKDIIFSSENPAAPAKFYFLSGPAHKTYPSRIITLDEAARVERGTEQSCNKRIIYQFIHPDVLDTCQLSMGLVRFQGNSVWNTMPAHTHERRMEVYFYFDMANDTVVFHLMGEPTETRHIVMRNEQAVISPSWSIHSGVGTNNYSFIWGMVGENQVFDDMDWIDMKKIL